MLLKGFLNTMLTKISILQEISQNIDAVFNLNSLDAGLFVMLLFSSVNFFDNFFSGTLYECQTFCIQIRTNILSGLTWVQSVCKGYQPMTKLPLARKELTIYFRSI